eukprot:3077569-Pyramimonas_sp.AAC.1
MVLPSTTYSFPDLLPPPAPLLPACSTRRLAGGESRAPFRALVKYLIEWSHAAYTLWAAYAQQLGKDIVGD